MLNRELFYSSLASSLALAFLVQSAAALTIDAFDSSCSAISSDTLVPASTVCASASAIGGISQLQKRIEKMAPLARNIEADDVAKSALYLLSDLSSGVTGETLYVDAGMNIMAY